MKRIRIGTRNSPLALWQANEVATRLQKKGMTTEIIPMVSQGDKNLVQPLYKMGIVGIFTKDLDIALLNNQIDIAVHSLKDIPTQLPENISVSAVLERDFPEDILIRNPKTLHKSYSEMHIGSGSLRRQAFWKHKFPKTTFGNIRGNIQTRLEKMESEAFDGVIFSLAGVKRMTWNLPYEILDFITPAPGQGVVACTSLEDNQKINTLLQKIIHKETQNCVTVEREFLQTLEGGCSAPIGANMYFDGMNYHFLGGIVSLDGEKSYFVDEKFTAIDEKLGLKMAEKLLKNGAEEILNEIK